MKEQWAPNSQAEEFIGAEIFHQCSQVAKTHHAVNLSQGLPEPIWDSQINQALSRSLDVGWQYADPRGVELLRSQISELIFNRTQEVSNILLTSGCTESLYLALLQIKRRRPNETIVFFEPFYTYYRGMCELLEMRSRAVPMLFTQFQFSPDWERVEQVFKQGPCTFILNTPHNPTGWVLKNQEAVQLKALIDRYQTTLLIDEAYKYYDYIGEEKSITLLTDANDDVIFAGSFSKLLSATGLRLGWVTAQSALIKQIHNAHLHLSYCQPAPLQKTVSTILADPNFSNRIKEIVSHYKNKRSRLYIGLKKIGLIPSLPNGGHFIVADYSALADSQLKSNELEWFVSEYGVMPLPMNPFYYNGKDRSLLRFSFSVSMNEIDRALLSFDNYLKGNRNKAGEISAG